MEINSNDTVGGPMPSPATAAKATTAKTDKDDSSGQKADRTDDGPDYQVNLSENAKNSVSEATPPADVSPPVAGEDVSEEEAAHLARQAASQLAQTNTAIANQAMQKAVDLFT